MTHKEIQEKKGARDVLDAIRDKGVYVGGVVGTSMLPMLRQGKDKPFRVLYHCKLRHRHFNQKKCADYQCRNKFPRESRQKKQLKRQHKICVVRVFQKQRA